MGGKTLKRTLASALANISGIESFAIRSGIEFPLRHLPYMISILKLALCVENWLEIIGLKARRKLLPGNDIGEQRVIFRHRGKRIVLAGNQCLSLALDTFVRGAYGSVDVCGKEVVDAGACLGDSAIYFLLSGARRVYALEPYPATYRLLEKNLAGNKALARVSPMNIGLGAKCSRMMLPLDDSAKPGNRRMHASSAGKRVEIMTLKGLVKKLGIKNAVLKMDCEAAEYGILLGSDSETLRSFSQIVMEYHYGYRDLAKYLERCGFCVRLLGIPHRPLLMDRGNADYVAGTLVASRKASR